VAGWRRRPRADLGGDGLALTLAATASRSPWRQLGTLGRDWIDTFCWLARDDNRRGEGELMHLASLESAAHIDISEGTRSSDYVKNHTRREFLGRDLGANHFIY
jgi:hypothetical protein